MGPGELGNIIATSLTNYAMPLLRFEHGDVGWYTDEPCSCGRTSRRIDVEGRLQALILRPGGRVIPTRDFMERLLPGKGVLLFKVIEHDEKNFELVYRPDPEQAADEDALRASLEELIGPPCEVAVTRVDVLDPAPSGKFRLVKSRSFASHRVLDDEKRRVELGEYW